MLRGVDPGPSLESALPQVLDLMHPLPPYMVWTGLDIAKAAHYIKLVSTSEKLVVEGFPIPMEHLSLLGRSMGMPTPHIIVQSGNNSWQTTGMT